MTSKLALGTEFENIERLKHECRHYAIENAFEFKTLRSTRDRYTIACKAENCGWRLYAFAVEGSSIFRIRTFNPDHSCFGINHRGNQQATSSYIANRISEKLRERPEYPPVDIVRDVQRELCRRCLIRGGALRLGGLLPFSPRERGEWGEHTRQGRRGEQAIREHKPVGKKKP